MKLQRALSYIAATLLPFVLFGACSSDAVITPAAGPPTLAIASISLGHGDTGQGGDTSVLVCDHTIGVTLAITNWTLKPPGLCTDIAQCGQVRVSLLDCSGSDGCSADVSSGKELGSAQFAATASVDLKLDDLLNLSDLKPPARYGIRAELVTDSGDIFNVTDGGNSAAQKTFNLSEILSGPLACPELTVGGAAGASGAPSEGGAAGFGGMPPELGQAGASGANGAGEGGMGGVAGMSGARD